MDFVNDVRGDELTDVDRFHTGGADGLHSQVGVFVSAAMLRRNSDTARSLEENVRSGLLMFHIFARDDGVKKMANFQVLKNLFDDVLHAA